MRNRGQKFKFRKFSKDPFHISFLIPNFITLLGLCCGISSLKFALNADWNFALVAIFFAGLFDFLDGAAARMLKASSVFGAQLDSLSDFMCFGVTPAFIIYCWNYKNYEMFGWISIIFYILCMVLRLARFNADSIKNDDQAEKNQQNSNQQKQKNSFFKGAPVTISAMLVLLPIILSNKAGFNIQFNQNFLKIWMPIYTIFISLLAISTIPTFSLKNIKLNKKYFRFFLLIIGLFIILLITYPWKIIPFILVTYLVSIVFSIVKYSKIH